MPTDSHEVDQIIADIVPRYRDSKGKPKPKQEFNLAYDSSTETLEPIYFWLIDWLERNYTNKVEKLVDTFASSPGSSHFQEMQGRASQMQQEASRVLGTVNQILKGVINLIYDLREFKIRLSHYEAAESKDKLKAEAGLLALKQIWMDKVDMLRGQGSLNALSSGNLQFVTLRDAFMAIGKLEDVDKLDLNDRVKRVLKPRVLEFWEWKRRSYEELKKRFEIEKIYLRSQVDALKLNSRWARPYLRAAEQLRGNETLMKDANMITGFNTVLLELSIMARSPINIDDATALNQYGRDLPAEFRKMKKLKKFYSVVLIDFNFRGIPGRSGQAFTFGGRADVYFRGYGLTDEEIELLKYRLDKADLAAGLKLVEGMTTESIAQIQADIDEFLPSGEEKKKDSESDPFSALFSFLSPKMKKKAKETPEEKEKRMKKLDEDVKKKGKISSDNYAEQYIRNYAEVDAMNLSFVVYDKYKSSHGMAKFPFGGNDLDYAPPVSQGDKLFGFYNNPHLSYG